LQNKLADLTGQLNSEYSIFFHYLLFYGYQYLYQHFPNRAHLNLGHLIHQSI